MRSFTLLFHGRDGFISDGSFLDGLVSDGFGSDDFVLDGRVSS